VLKAASKTVALALESASLKGVTSLGRSGIAFSLAPGLSSNSLLACLAIKA